MLNFKRVGHSAVEEYFKNNLDKIIIDGEPHEIYIKGYTDWVYYKVTYVYKNELITYESEYKVYSADNVPF